MSTRVSSGVAVVVTAVPAVALGSGYVWGPVWLRAPNANVGQVFVGNNGSDDVTSTTHRIIYAQRY